MSESVRYALFGFFSALVLVGVGGLIGYQIDKNAKTTIEIHAPRTE